MGTEIRKNLGHRTNSMQGEAAADGRTPATRTSQKASLHYGKEVFFVIQLFLFSENNQFTENIIQNNYEHTYKSLRPKAVYTQKALI